MDALSAGGSRVAAGNARHQGSLWNERFNSPAAVTTLACLFVFPLSLLLFVLLVLLYLHFLLFHPVFCPPLLRVTGLKDSPILRSPMLEGIDFSTYSLIIQIFSCSKSNRYV